jgi:hypothetical protein
MVDSDVLSLLQLFLIQSVLHKRCVAAMFGIQADEAETLTKLCMCSLSVILCHGCNLLHLAPGVHFLVTGLCMYV